MTHIEHFSKFLEKSDLWKQSIGLTLTLKCRCLQRYLLQAGDKKYPKQENVDFNQLCKNAIKFFQIVVLMMNPIRKIQGKIGRQSIFIEMLLDSLRAFFQEVISRGMFKTYYSLCFIFRKTYVNICRDLWNLPYTASNLHAEQIHQYS